MPDPPRSMNKKKREEIAAAEKHHWHLTHERRGQADVLITILVGIEENRDMEGIEGIEGTKNGDRKNTRLCIWKYHKRQVKGTEKMWKERYREIK